MKRIGAVLRSSSLIAFMALSGISGTVRAQSLASRVAGVHDGSVRMSFASRPDVCGRGNSVNTDGNSSGRMSSNYTSNRDVEWEYDCENGPVRLVMDVRAGEIRTLRTYVGGRWKQVQTPVTDLGIVSAREAADYLLGLAEHLPASAGEKAIFPATIADSVTVWPNLIRIARNSDVPGSTRRQAVFWVSQSAGDAATKGLDELVGDNSVAREVREQAVFALSQRPKDQGVPALIQVARTNRDPEIRRKAMFWLGQSNDPRAISLFEEILGKQ